MISIRKWLYKPRRDDKSLFAKFWYADDNLNRVAAELDSFDGRKDPERCAALVSKLRSCQDKLLNICNKMLDELEGPDGRANREFRVKFPDEIVTENLGGQLWFGAECLAAGSSIMQKEFESAQMRPLAKAVTKTLEKVRGLIREQCLSATPQYTEQIHETLKIFDRMFAEFEFSYVSCMVHVKTIEEYEIHQDVICLFSETLQRSIKNKLITQDMVDLYDPSLMFAIPRLAIVTGLLIFPSGPLNVDREYSDFPELFRPFKNLLRKIRELLWTLTPAEFYVLERLLCQLEEPDDLQRKLQVAQIELEEKQRIAENIEKQENQAALLDAKLTSLSNIPCVCDTQQQQQETDTSKVEPHCDTLSPTPIGSRTTESLSMPASPSLMDNSSILSSQIISPNSTTASEDVNNTTTDKQTVVDDIINELLSGVVGIDLKDQEPVNISIDRQRQLPEEAVGSSCSSSQELRRKSTDGSSSSSSRRRSCDRDTRRHHSHRRSSHQHYKEETDQEGKAQEEGRVRLQEEKGDAQRESSSRRKSKEKGSSKERKCDSTPTKKTVVEIDCSGPDITVSPVDAKTRSRSGPTPQSAPPTDGFRVVERARKGLKRRGAKRSHKSWKEARARFKSSEDLIHRLYVCISGAADQLQTNFAGDFRHILKYVFVMNATQEDEYEQQEQDDTEEETTESADDIHSENEDQDSVNSQELPQDTASNTSLEQQQQRATAVAGQTADSGDPARTITYSTPSRNSTGYECGEDALMNESEQTYLRSFASVAAAAAANAAGGSSTAAALLSTSPPSMLASMPVYASNLDQHIDRALLTEGHGGETDQFYQPEPTLLTIASGASTSSGNTPTEEQKLPDFSRCSANRGLAVTANRLSNPVSLAYDDFKASENGSGSPLVVCHGMLGSRQNWTSIAKQVNKQTGRRVITVDARNHGDSPHTDHMSYASMALDVVKLVKDLSLGPVSLMGHSMGGRTIMMLAALYSQEINIDKMIVVDISPLNQDFDVTSSNEWNMEHYFYCLKGVHFDEAKTLFQARKMGDQQLAVRISDPMLRAWLLMNLRQNPETQKIEWRINLDGIHKAFKTEIARIKIPEDKIPAYSGPCLFVGGADSDYIPVSDHEEIKEIFPGATFKYVEGAGHWVHSQKPHQFLETIMPFIKS